MDSVEDGRHVLKARRNGVILVALFLIGFLLDFGLYIFFLIFNLNVNVMLYYVNKLLN